MGGGPGGGGSVTPHVPHAFRQRDQNTLVPSKLSMFPRGSHVVWPAEAAASIAQLTVCAGPSPNWMTINHDGSSRHWPGARGGGVVGGSGGGMVGSRGPELQVLHVFDTVQQVRAHE